MALFMALPVALLGAVATAAQERAPSPGEAAFTRVCAGCHSDPRGIGGRATGLDDPARRATLDRFLARHHARDPAERAAILSWLAEVSR